MYVYIPSPKFHTYMIFVITKYYSCFMSIKISLISVSLYFLSMLTSLKKMGKTFEAGLVEESFLRYLARMLLLLVFRPYDSVDNICWSLGSLIHIGTHFEFHE